MRRYFVTFGCGTIFGGLHHEFVARDEDIVRRWCNKHLPSVWSNIYASEPTNSVQIPKKPTELHYLKAEHV